MITISGGGTITNPRAPTTRGRRAPAIEDITAGRGEWITDGKTALRREHCRFRSKAPGPWGPRPSKIPHVDREIRRAIRGPRHPVHGFLEWDGKIYREWVCRDRIATAVSLRSEHWACYDVDLLRGFLVATDPARYFLIAITEASSNNALIARRGRSTIGLLMPVLVRGAVPSGLRGAHLRDMDEEDET